MLKIDDKLIGILDKYIPRTETMDSGGKQIQQMYSTFDTPEILIPVLGLQGVGKSTLLNALLKENIMPNETDETTCIPVEVRYSKTQYVMAYFLDGSSSKIEVDMIKEYVDNNYNDGNEKLVSHIVIFRDLEILKNGIVLVDLPGVGSMTINNQRVTQEYIKKLYTAIFVLRVNPPITRTESIFIKFAWQSLSNAWFVQNKWNNESEREVKEGYEANQIILKDIANSNNMDFNEDLITVNAYGGLVGVLQNKDDYYNDSNVSELEEKLKSVDANWMNDMKVKLNKRVFSMIQLSERYIEDQLSKNKLSYEELKEKFNREEEEFERNTLETNKVIKDLKEIMEVHKREAVVFIRRLMGLAEENIRGNIFNIIDAGVTDGENLNQAFRDYQHQEFTIINDEFMEFLNEKMSIITEKTKGLEDLIELEQDDNYDAYEFNKRQELKWEKGVDVGIKLGGGIGSVVLGLKVGTAIGGPIGGFVGAGVAVVAGMFTSLMGRKSKSLVVAERASKTKREIRPVIDELCESMRKQLVEVFFDIYDNSFSNLEDYYLERVKALQITKERNLDILKSDLDGIDNNEVLEQDRDYLHKEAIKFNV